MDKLVWLLHGDVKKGFENTGVVVSGKWQKVGG